MTDGKACWAAMALLPVVALAAAAAGAAEPASPAGRWFTGADGGVVEIAPCGIGALCGRIVGITPDHPGAAVPVDSTGHSECGLTIISGAAKTGKDEWSGQILDPRDGRTYHARLSVDATGGRLQVRAYVGLAIFGETVVWTRFGGRIGENCRIAGPETREAGPVGD